MNALDFHGKVLSSVNVRDVDGDGYLTAFPDKDMAIPVSIGGKRLVLPTKEIMKKAPWDDCIGFNPFSERLTRGESPVLKFTKDAISLRINALFGHLFTSLCLVASDPALQKRMGPKVAELLKSCPEASEKTLAKAKKLVDIVHRQPQHNFISMYLKHGGENGASRTCVVSFPVLEALSDEETTEIIGLKLTSAKDKDKARLKGLMEYILDDLKAYTFGSDSPEAPYYHSLLTSYNLLALRLNGLFTKYKKVIEDADEFKVDLSWSEGLEDFEGFRGQISSLEGNEGAVLVDAADDKKVEAAKASVFSRQQAVVEEPTREERSERKRDEVERDERPDRSRDRERSRDRSENPMDKFRSQFESNEPERSSTWGRKGSDDRDSWGRERGGRGRDDDRGRGRSRGRSSGGRSRTW